MARNSDITASTAVDLVDSAAQPALGEHLRALRRARGHSLAEVAEATSISRSFLSLVEAGKSDITIGRLMKLVEFYRTSVADLLASGSVADPVVVRADRRRVVEVSGAEGMEFHLAAPDTHRTMMPVVIFFEPGGETIEYARHEGEEYVFVLEGRIALDLGEGGQYLLEEGDSAYYDSSRPHSFKNACEGRARFLAVVTPPTL